MLQVIALIFLAILVVVANPSVGTEMFDMLPVTPVEKSKGSCRLVIDQSMKRIRDHCAKEDIPHVMDIPTSSPLLPYPRIMDPTHPPKVQDPIGRPHHPTTKPHPVYNQTTTKPPTANMVTTMPAVYNPIGTMPPATISTNMPAVYNPIATGPPTMVTNNPTPQVSFTNM